MIESDLTEFIVNCFGNNQDLLSWIYLLNTKDCFSFPSYVFLYSIGKENLLNVLNNWFSLALTETKLTSEKAVLLLFV